MASTMADIQVSLTEEQDGWLAQVTIVDDQGSSSHEVALTRGDYQRLCQGRCPPEELMRASFEFLLQREPKESILARFELPIIGHYFAEYEEWLAQHLPGA
ncbi:MAG: hypothetical protein ACOC6A_05555 [Chloroflexota bacterium]